MHGSYHWTYERALSLTTLPLVVGGMFYSGNSIIDFGLATVLPLHCHIGFSAIITDYLPRRKFPVIYPIAYSLLLIGTGAAMFGLYSFNTNDVGISQGIKNIYNRRKE